MTFFSHHRYSSHKNTEFKIDCGLMKADAYIYCGSEDGRICFWDIVDSLLVHSIQAHDKPVCALSSHPKDQMMISGSLDGTAKIWGS